ncbi:glutamate-1-semialdehyde 2,1-aminomutase [Bradyrhizobium sp. LM2.7]
MFSTPHATLAVTDTHKSALRRALRVTASEKWDLNRRFPLVMSRASGAHVWDVDGRRYVDLTSCSGAAPLGAGYEPVVDHVVSELRRTGGILPGPLSVHRIELAERLAEIFPRAQRSLFFRTGSCATTAAIRLARAHMGTNLVLTSGYHGWHDWHLQDRPAMGLPDRDRDSVDFRYDLDLFEKLSGEQRVAAVIITPEVNFFPPEYHRELQNLVHRRGALLILDEVMTGFRYGLGGYHTALGLAPDLITLSKGLANGMALSAVAGRAEVLNAAEKTYLGNTYQREITPFAAALSTLDALRNGAALARMRQVGMQIINGLNGVFASQ